MARTGLAALAVSAIIACGSAAAEVAAPDDALPADLTVAAAKAGDDKAQCTPGFGCVTNLPLPRYVTLKTSEGNARRGPGLSHRIDWVFTRVGMPLRVTAEYENWRRVEDAEGAGGWMHYALLSGSRSVLVAQDMADFRNKPDTAATVLLQAEMGVVARLMECSTDWCRVSIGTTEEMRAFVAVLPETLRV